MRPLTDEETKAVFTKLEKFIGKEGIKAIIDRKDETHVFRLHKNRVFYIGESHIKSCSSFSREKLISSGMFVGKMTHTGRFRITIHFLGIVFFIENTKNYETN